MSALSNARAAQRRVKIPNPLKAADSVWKAAAGPNPPTPKVGNGYGPPIQIAGTRPQRRRRGAGGYSKGTVPG